MVINSNLGNKLILFISMNSCHKEKLLESLNIHTPLNVFPARNICHEHINTWELSGSHSCINVMRSRPGLADLNHLDLNH